MKKLISIVALLLAVVACYFGCKKPEETGTIYGTVTDSATGEPIKSAGVELLPIGLKTVTGNDGSYMFSNIETGEYELFITKTGYEDIKKSGIKVKGEVTQYDVQMAKQPAALCIVDDQGNEMTTLDFGDEVEDVSRLFNIFNASESSLQWEITTTAVWIQSVSCSSGILSAGDTKGIIVVINRNDLPQGECTTTLHVTSNNGNKQLTIKAKRVDVSTLEATGVSSNSAVLHGKINIDIPYSERGFFYGTNHNLNSHCTVEGNGTGPYSSQITGLSGLQTYYFKAYYVYNGEYIYGEEKSFGPYVTSPTFVFNGHTYMVAPDPHSTSETPYSQYISWYAANSYCENLTLYGYTDWRLPTADELLTMYQMRESIGGFIDSYEYLSSSSVWHTWNSVYHSSTPYNVYSNTYHIFVDWSDGGADCDIDGGIEYTGYSTFYGRGNIYAHVRPVRVEN